jgi:hypothetical protein
MRTIAHTTTGPVHLTLDLGPGWVHVVVEDRGTAEIMLAPHHDDDQTAADLIARAAVDHADRALSVTMPRPMISGIGNSTIVRSSGRGGVRVSQTSTVVTGSMTGLVITSGGDVYVAGRRIVGDTTTVHSGGLIRAEVRLPLGSTLTVDTDAADVDVTGHLDRLSFISTSGNLAAGTVGTLNASTASGKVAVNQVATGTVKTMSGNVVADYSTDIRVKTMSGDVWLIASTGRQAEISTMSGDIQVTAHHDGHVDASTMSGDITVLAAQSRTVTTNTRSMSGRVRVPGTR